MITYDSIKESIILNRLEGWKIQSEEIQDESYLHLDDNNLITSNEVEELFLQAKNQLKNYLVVDELPNDDRLVYPLCTWTAGLLYKKYDHVPTQTLDDGTYVGQGRGNDLINEAKTSVYPWQQSKMSIW